METRIKYEVVLNGNQIKYIGNNSDGGRFARECFESYPLDDGDTLMLLKADKMVSMRTARPKAS